MNRIGRKCSISCGFQVIYLTFLISHLYIEPVCDNSNSQKWFEFAESFGLKFELVFYKLIVMEKAAVTSCGHMRISTLTLNIFVLLQPLNTINVISYGNFNGNS